MKSVQHAIREQDINYLQAESYKEMLFDNLPIVKHLWICAFIILVSWW